MAIPRMSTTHLIDGEFQSDKYPTTPRGKVPLSVKDRSAQDLLWEYAQRRRGLDEEFSRDLETALRTAGFAPRGTAGIDWPSSDYPNLHAFLIGTVSGHVSEWIMLKPEIRKAFAEIERLRGALQSIRAWDMLDDAHDGSYFKGLIASALGKNP